MPFATVRRKLDAVRFIQEYKEPLTTRGDGSQWGRWQGTWLSGVQYFRGVLLSGRGKTMGGIAKRRNIDPERIEQFIRESPWEHEQVQQHLRSTVPDELQDGSAVLVIDEMGILKKGDHSVGVATQYCGTVGRTANCQVTVNLTLARPGEERNKDQVTWPLGIRLYLPNAWAEDRKRRTKAAVPLDVEFQTKPEIAGHLVADALQAGVRAKALTGDCVYGDNTPLREHLREARLPYVLMVTNTKLQVIPEDTPLVPPGPRQGGGRPAKHWMYPKDVVGRSPPAVAEGLDERAWRRVQWSVDRDGEPLAGWFYRERVRVVQGGRERHATQQTGWLLLEKTEGEAGDEIQAWICWGLDDEPLEELVRIAHVRWSIEEFHRDASRSSGWISSRDARGRGSTTTSPW